MHSCLIHYHEVNGMKIKKELEAILTKEVSQVLEKCKGIKKEEELLEIRLNIGQPLIVKCKGGEYILKRNGEVTKDFKEGLYVTANMVRDTFSGACKYSAYAFEEEVRQGFLTIEGGHRIGIVGQAIMEEGRVKNLKYISGLNIRVANENIGCGEVLMKEIYNHRELASALIVSMPGGGKTTLLRDCIRVLSEGTGIRKGYRVGVVDERGELGAAYRGIIQNHLGPRTDLLDRISKKEGIFMLLRSMAPEIIAVDEIGSKEDEEALHRAMLCGCKLLATAHAASIQEARIRFESLGIFEYYILLDAKHVGRIQEIYQSTGIRQKKEALLCGS